MTPESPGSMPDKQATAMRLLELRQSARANRDFAAADVYRDAIAQLGFVVVDTAEGPHLESKPTQILTDIARGFPPYGVGSQTAVTVIVDGWLSDVATFVNAVLAHEPHSTHLLLVDVANDADLASALEDMTDGDERISVVHLAKPAGWAQVHAAAAAACQADFYAAADMSTVLDGPLVSQCAQVLASQPEATAAGWRGANVNLADDWRSVTDAGAGPCDVLLSYLMVVPTSLARRVPPNPRASFYRNADIEWSLMLRAHVLETEMSGGSLPPLMIAFGADAPAHQGRHHGYHDSDPQVRDRESKKNYDRILKTFRGRTELLSR